MWPLCQYKNIFGEPNKGVHSYRLFGLAIVDVVMTILAGFLFAKLFKVDLLKTIIILFLLGIIFHRLFCVRTTIDKMLFS